MLLILFEKKSYTLANCQTRKLENIGIAEGIACEERWHRLVMTFAIARMFITQGAAEILD